MALSQYHPDVQLLLASLFDVYQDNEDPRGRFVAYMHNPLGSDLLPPGQAWPMVAGEPLLCEPFLPKQRAETDWAAVPYFYSAESAWKMVMWWVNHHCLDRVKACQKESLEGLSYRAAQARKLEGQYDQTT